MKTALVFAALFTFSAAVAQQKEGGTESTSIYGVQVIVSGAPRPIDRARRIPETPQTADTSVSVPPMAYSNVPSRTEVKTEPERLKAVNLSERKDLEKLYRFYAKAGVGSYTMPLGEIYFNDIYNKKGTYGIYARHHSSQGGIRHVGYSGFSDNNAGAFIRHYTKKLEIGGGVDYQRNVVHYYGFRPDTIQDLTMYPDGITSKDRIRQRYNYVGAQVSLGTFHPDTLKLNHREELQYYNFGDAYKATENYFSGKTKLHKKVGREIFGLGFSASYNRFLPSVRQNRLGTGNVIPPAAQENILATLNPTILTNGRNWVAKVGLAVSADVYDGSGKFYFYPDVEFRYSLFNDMLIPYAGVNGNVQRNSFRSLAAENPFIISEIDLRNTNRKLHLYGGFRGALSRSVAFNLKASFLKAGDVALFYTDTVYSLHNQFRVMYDNIDIFSVSGQLSWQREEKLKLLLKGEYFNYSTTREAYAWNMPDYRVTASGVYDLFDKILVRLDIVATGTRWAPSLRPVEGVALRDGLYPVKLKPFVDANIGLEYRYTKRLSAFLNFNNIVAQRYQYWYQYPVQGFNLMGGVTYSF